MHIFFAELGFFSFIQEGEVVLYGEKNHSCFYFVLNRKWIVENSHHRGAQRHTRKKTIHTLRPKGNLERSINLTDMF